MRFRTPVRFLAVLALAALIAFAVGGPSGAGATDPVSRARQALAERAGLLGIERDLSSLRPESARRGVGADYVRFVQVVQGRPVVGSDLVVMLPYDAAVSPAVNSNYRSGLGSATTGVEQVSQASALLAALAAAKGSLATLRAPPALERVYVPVDKELIPAWRVTLALNQPTRSLGILIRSDTGEVLYVVDLLRWDSGRVFDPNPPSGSGGAIPPPSHCDGAAEEGLLTGRYVTRTLQGISPGQDKLKGDYVDLTAPGITGAYKPAGLADEPLRSYVYPCTDDRFEEVMTYYHVDAVQRKLQRLGFAAGAAVLARPVAAHAHYFADCNAFYDPVDRGIHFGDGDTCSPTVDTGEDGDVIVHEYGHALQDDQVPGWGFGPAAEAEQAWAMGEGFGDFLAAATFGDPCLGEWFAAPDSCLRTIENTNHYPEDFEACRQAPPFPAEPHCAGLIWGGALWDLVQALGTTPNARDIVLTLVVESHFMLDPASTFVEAAAAIVQADQLVFGGAHAGQIQAVFATRGILPSAVSDFPYAFLQIRHTFRGDLDVDLIVGDPAAPACTVSIQSPSNNAADDVFGYLVLGPSTCASGLPPGAAQPWRLRVQDVGALDVGTIEQFQVALGGRTRCLATDVPMAIPDAGPAVYSVIDCSKVITGDLVDSDGDGYNNGVETHVGTDPYAPCATSGWPADLHLGTTANRLDITDVLAFVAPTRHLGTSPGDQDFSVRFDVVPGQGILLTAINIQDILSLATVTPPMFGGQRAFGQVCG